MVGRAVRDGGSQIFRGTSPFGPSEMAQFSRFIRTVLIDAQSAVDVPWWSQDQHEPGRQG